jgi:hypothetical protein
MIQDTPGPVEFRASLRANGRLSNFMVKSCTHRHPLVGSAMTDADARAPKRGGRKRGLIVATAIR